VLLVVVLLFAALYIYISANKKSLIAQVKEQMSESINGDVVFDNTDISFFRSFPKVAVHVQNIRISDTMYQQHKHALLEAKDFFANLSLVNIIQKKSPVSGLKIRHGSVFIFTDTSGYTNGYLLASKKDPKGGPKTTTKNISLRDLVLQDMRIIMLNKQKRKYHDFVVHDLDVDLKDDGNDLLLKTSADILVKSISFRQSKGTFLKDASFRGKFTLVYSKTNQLLSFHEIKPEISGQPFVLTGSFDLGEKNPAFKLKVNVSNVSYDGIKKLMPHRIDSSLSMVSLQELQEAEADIFGPFRGGDPYVIVRWKAKDVTLKTMFMDFDHATFNGVYKNEVVPGLPRKDPNSMISVSAFTADWHGLKVKADSINIMNLTNPVLTCNLRSAFPLTSLNNLLQSESLKLNAGDGEVLLSYSGPVIRNTNTNSFLNGFIRFKNGKVLYTPRNVLMTNVNGLLKFTNSNLLIENIQCRVLEHNVAMNGSADNLLTLIDTEPNKVSIRYHIFTPTLNLASFTYLLKSRTPVKTVSDNKLKNLSNKIDDVLERGRIEVDLKANQLIYHNLNASNLQAGITVLQDRYLLDRVSMNFAEGSMALKGQLINLRNNVHNASVSADLKNVDVKKVFYSFGNFGQDGLTDKNIEGDLTARADVSLTLNDDGKPLPSSTNGVVDFSLKNGVLNNFEPLKKIQQVIFKKRDFDNVRFAELKNRLTISAGEIKINRMEIQSSVLSFFAEGVFSQKGNTDISVQVPFSNLKKRETDYEPENIGVDKKGGRSIFLRGQPGDDGNIKFKLDLFKRYQKDNE
jgi:hypothetical protein